MTRKLPVIFLELLENWLQNCFSCIKWTQVFSATPSRSDLELGRSLYYQPFCLLSIWTTFRSFDHCYLDHLLYYIQMTFY